MSETAYAIKINVVIEIFPETLQSIVKLEKEAAGFGNSRVQQVDTAGKVGQLISRFLAENGFDAFARDPANYSAGLRTIRFDERA